MFGVGRGSPNSRERAARVRAGRLLQSQADNLSHLRKRITFPSCRIYRVTVLGRIGQGLPGPVG